MLRFLQAPALTGVNSHPKPFKCTIKPRSAKAEALIFAAEEHA